MKTILGIILLVIAGIGMITLEPITRYYDVTGGFFFGSALIFAILEIKFTKTRKSE